jgi:hypothetical protein
MSSVTLSNILLHEKCGADSVYCSVLVTFLCSPKRDYGTEMFRYSEALQERMSILRFHNVKRESGSDHVVKCQTLELIMSTRSDTECGEMEIQQSFF